MFIHDSSLYYENILCAQSMFEIELKRIIIATMSFEPIVSIHKINTNKSQNILQLFVQ